MEKKQSIKEQIDKVIRNKAGVLQNAYSKSLEQLVEDLKIYQYELEFQNDELQRIQAELEKSRNDYRGFFEFAPISYLILDEFMQIKDCNHHFKALLSELEIRNEVNDFRKIIHPEDQDNFHFFRSSLSKESSSKQIDLRLASSDSEDRFVNLVANLFTDESGEILYRFALKDISERKRIEVKMNRIREILDMNSKLARIGGWELNLLTNQLFWTDITIEIHELQPDFRPDLNTSIQFYLEGYSRDKIRSVVNLAIDHSIPFDEELQIVTAKGQVRWVRAIGQPEFRDGKCNRVYGVIQDIEEKKKQEEILKSNEIRLKELNNVKDRFFSILAHDLKSPFNSILGFSEILKEQIEAAEYHEAAESASIVYDSSSKIYNLLIGLLEWYKMQSGREAFNPVQLSLDTLIDETISLSYESAKDKKISLLKSEMGSISVYADKAMIGTVLRNLIFNALKFTRREGAVSVSATQELAGTRITVQDNGVGISPDDVNKLFKLDHSFSTAGTSQEVGSGLGLLLCKELIDKHNGKIWVESEVGKGSSFHFILPAN